MKRMRSGLLAVVTAWAWAAPAWTSPAEFDPGLSGYRVIVDGLEIPYRVFTVPVLPGASLAIEVRGADAAQASAPRGALRSEGDGRWRFTAPGAPGLAPVEIHDARGTPARIQVFVMRRASEVSQGRLQGYEIGSYPGSAPSGESIYQPPPGFVEVTAELADAPVSPHFQLGQFLCKQEGGFPKYLVLRPQLLAKLERILQRVNAEGFRAYTLSVLSGYRTPSYNAAIGNVRYSRHQWGDAADVFVDVDPQDGTMDDLDGDGRVDERDAERLYRWIDDLDPSPWYRRLLGGLASYAANGIHGPFVHVDVRGRRARW